MKDDGYVKKAIVPSKFASKYGSGSRRWGGGGGSKGRDRSRSRSPRRDSDSYRPARKWRGRGGGGGSGSGAGKKRGKSGGGGSGDPPAKRSKKSSRDRGTPMSFTEAWNGYFKPDVISLVASFGLCLDDIPGLDDMPIGGRISHPSCFDNWSKVVSNTWVLNVVKDGYKIPLRTIPKQARAPTNPSVSGSALDVLNKEADDLLAKQAVTKVKPVYGEFVSSYFAVPKPHRIDQWRPILNLKVFNYNVKKYKFSMETARHVRDWIRPGYYAISMDIRDAYLHISVNPGSRKFLRFVWRGDLLQWDVIPFGLTCSPRVLTKVLKPVISFLRQNFQILVSIYMDDILVQALTPQQCTSHAQIVMLVLMSLGWSLKWEKCSLSPSQTFLHLGFIFNTRDMTISCPQEKVLKLVDMCSKIFDKKRATVLSLEKLIGTMESMRPAVPLASLNFRCLQKLLISAKKHGRLAKKFVDLTPHSLAELEWWINVFPSQCTAPLQEPEPTVDIWSDASLHQAGFHCSRGRFGQQAWSTEELRSDPHINLLEIRAARLALALAEPGDRVRLHIDSRVAARYILRQGGTKSLSLSREACRLWRFAVDLKIQILSPHWLASKENALADLLSRTNLSQWECQLSRETFLWVLETLMVSPSPTLDVFASRDTAQLPRYMSWYPDPQAVARNAMMHSWDASSYAFPPAPLILKTLQKIRQERIQAVLILPRWPSALWWPILQEMLVAEVPLPHYTTCISMVDPSMTLPYLDPLMGVLVNTRL